MLVYKVDENVINKGYSGICYESLCYVFVCDFRLNNIGNRY